MLKLNKLGMLSWISTKTKFSVLTILSLARLSIIVAQQSEYPTSVNYYHELAYPTNEQLIDHRLLIPTATSVTPTAANDRTIISDLIGFSAFKFLAIFAIPLVLSIFLGAMLVLLFPFPLITSTAGLAGAAAVGRRSGREFQTGTSSTVPLSTGLDNDELGLLQFLGLDVNNDQYTASPVKIPIRYEPISEIDYPLSVARERETKVKKKDMKIRKVKKIKGDGKYHERCAERIACEVGRSADSHFRNIMNQVLEELPLQSRQKWKSTINAYIEGVQQVSPKYYNQGPSSQMVSHGPHPVPIVGPVYPHNKCPQYKCDL